MLTPAEVEEAADPITAQAVNDAEQAERDALAAALGPSGSDNAREHFTNGLLLALLEGTPPDPADVATLRAIHDAVENSPVRDAILAGN